MGRNDKMKRDLEQTRLYRNWWSDDRYRLQACIANFRAMSHAAEGPQFRGRPCRPIF